MVPKGWRRQRCEYTWPLRWEQRQLEFWQFGFPRPQALHPQLAREKGVVVVEG